MIINVENINFSDTSSPVKKSVQNVFYGDAVSFVDNLPVFYNYLSDNEKKRADCYRLESDYLCYISAHALLRVELSKILCLTPKTVKIAQIDNGKPYLCESDIPFSLSRSKRLFVFTIGKACQLIGIDVEKINVNIDIAGISKSYYNPKEYEHIFSFKKASAQQRSFFEIWTRKEALLKAIGIGINTDLRNVQVLEGTNQFNIQGVKHNSEIFCSKTFSTGDIVISIVSSVDFFPRLIDLSISSD